MLPSLPISVEIGGVTIAIRIEKLEAYGEYHGDEHEIVLSSRCLDKHSLMRETLRHEMLHAAFDICGISYLERFEEESVTRCIENVFFPAWEKVHHQITIIE